jgi:hypothetical protein
MTRTKSIKELIDKLDFIVILLFKAVFRKLIDKLYTERGEKLWQHTSLTKDMHE